LQFVADGVVKSEPTVRDFSEINDILDDIAALKVVGRNVVKIPEIEE
jgi:D-arabinose 1-dehydrogenase-like Zn-dependent alcohol dehydrogenase